MELSNTILTILCSISFAACLSVIIIYFSCKSLRTLAFKFIFWLNFSNFIKSFAGVMSEGLILEYSELCQIDAYFFYSSSLASFLWTSVIANKLYKSMNEAPDSESNLWVYFTSIYSLSFSIGAIPFIFNQYNREYPHCDLKLSRDGDIIRFSIFYIPALLVFIYIGVIYFRVIKVAWKENVYSKRDTIRLSYFPLVMVFCILPAFIARVLNFYKMSHPIVNFICLALVYLHGFFDALAYAFTPPVMKFLKSLCNKKDISRPRDSESFLLHTYNN